AVASDRPLEDVPGLRGGENNPPFAAVAPNGSTHDGRVTAGFRFISNRAEYTPPVIYSNAQRAKLVFMVEARPSAADGARLKPGQPVDVLPVAGATP
ncbi:MAG: hypothetical protein WA157_01690, partial [Rhodoferax ferrireducens]